MMLRQKYISLRIKWKKQIITYHGRVVEKTEDTVRYDCHSLFNNLHNTLPEILQTLIHKFMLQKVNIHKIPKELIPEHQQVTAGQECSDCFRAECDHYHKSIVTGDERGILQIKFLPHGNTINTNHYCGNLKKLYWAIKKK